MQIQSANSFIPTRGLARAQSASVPQEKLTLVEPPPDGYNPSTPVPGGKWIVGAVAAFAAGALGAYAGSNLGTGAVVSGALAGGLTAGVGLGTVGLMKDISGGFSGKNSNATKYGLGIGAAVGGLGGGLLGAYASNPFAGAALGLAAAAATGFAAVAIADEALR